MKKIIPCFFLFLFLSSITYSQTLAVVDTGKYSINLPDYWRPGNKVWQILTDKLPLVSEELKDKELCGDNCNPKYSLEFEMSEPVVYDYYSNHISSGSTSQTWEFVTLYTFSSSLLLLNEKNELVTRFILVDTNEVWRVMHRASLASFVPAPRQNIYVSTDPIQEANNVQINRSMQANSHRATPGQSPFSYINNNKDKLHPTRRDMLGVIDEKIRSW